MTGHTLALIWFGGLIFQLGCVLSIEKDKRPWTTARYMSALGGLVCLTAAVWLALRAW